MPGSYDSDDSTSSPSLITGLRTFRFQKNRQPSQPSAESSVLSGRSLSTGDSSVGSPERSGGISVIPETPPQNLKNSSDSCNGTGLNSREGSSSPGPRISRKIIGVARYSDSGEMASSSCDLQEEKDLAMDEYELFCEKEQCLREFLKHHPQADIMEAQDLLVSTRWDLTKALKEATEKPLHNSRKRGDSATAKGVVFKDASAKKASSVLPSVQEEILLHSDGETSVAQVSSTVNGKHSGINGARPLKNYANKRRRIIHIEESDDEDDPTTSSAPKQNSDYSVLDYEPPKTQLLLQQSRSADCPKPQSYSRLAPHSTSERVVNSSVFTDEERNFMPKKVPAVKKAPVVRNAPKLKQSSSSSSKKKRRRLDSDEEDESEEYGNEDVYDSEDSDSGENLTPARSGVLNFFRDSTIEELLNVPGCSKKKAEALINYRPYKSWVDLVQKLNGDKMLSGELLNGAKKVLDMRLAVNRLMNKCQKIALQMEDLVEALKENKEESKDYVSKQPGNLNSNMNLSPYQMLGLNWLLLMHNQEVNGILADEMGLGKTIQAIAFLAYLQEQEIPGPHLIVVPSSTLDNWQNELQLWWPSASVVCYHGSQDNRREMRLKIINDEIEEFDVMVTTYNMVASSAEDRSFFKKLEFHYVIFDEAHMLKNMSSQRYQNLMKVKAGRRLLLTGTPLQNNLVELMSLLIFAMPHMFSGKTEQVKQMFSSVSKTEERKSSYEREKIEHAKRIMKPFVLRRLKSEVLKDLPAKHVEIKFCSMSEKQAQNYTNLVAVLSAEVKEKDINTSGTGMMMQLRKAANHPLLLRNHYDDDMLTKMTKLILMEPTHLEANCDFVFEDMSVMSDFELHKLCQKYKGLKSFTLRDEQILDSGKFALLDELLPQKIKEGHRILLFSQFTMVLDVIEDYMNIKKHKFLRLDGQIPVHERQLLIDEYNKNPDISVFLLSTRAGGLGINLTAADTVLIHDIDFNPYNDKQAEDRSHRVGQTRDVTVIRMISEDTIEEGMLQRANEKLRLEKDITDMDNDEEKDSGSVAKLLREALGLKAGKS